MSIAVLLVAQPGLAAAPDAPPLPEARTVAVLPPRCRSDSFLLVSFLDSLRVELAGRGLRCCALGDPADWPPPSAAVRVEVELVPCTTDADRVQVSVLEAARSRAVEREVSLADVAQPARPRALALAVAELIRSLGQGAPVEKPVQTAAPAKESMSSPSPPKDARPAPAAFSIHVEAEARSLPTRDTTMWGGRVRFTGHWRALHADLDVGGDFARARVAQLGDVLVRSASAGLGLGPRFATRAVIIDLGLHAELGWAWIRGAANSEGVRAGAGSDLISSAGLRLSFEAPARAKVRPSATLEGGGVVRGVLGDANDRPVTGINGYYLLAALGVGFSL